MTAENTTAPDTFNLTRVKRIAEAIRKNGMKQIWGSYYQYKNKGESNFRYPGDEVIAACAIGQAAVNLDESADILHANLNIRYRVHLKCPTDTHNNTIVGLGDMIAHLNDNHQWSFTEIADYLDKWVEDNA